MSRSDLLTSTSCFPICCNEFLLNVKYLEYSTIYSISEGLHQHIQQSINPIDHYLNYVIYGNTLDIHGLLGRASVHCDMRLS